MHSSIEQRLAGVGVSVPEVLLPSDHVDLYRWAVIACDQHTSEPDYWEEVESIVGERPSTLRLVYPEVYLEDGDRAARIESIHSTMRRYLSDETLRSIGPAMVLSRRGTPHVSERRGLLLALDLEHYDYRPGATSLVRATERTIVDRIPPRVEVRRGAPLELPHVLVLIDDPEDRLFGGLLTRRLEQLYATQLMLGGGEVSGFRLDDDAVAHVAESLEGLRHDASGDHPFLFAVGDGNHSLATAKAVWDEMKATAPAEHPARYALVEVVNLYDPGLRFAPIHRLVECDEPEAWAARFAEKLGGEMRRSSPDELQRSRRENGSVIGLITAGATWAVTAGGTRDLPISVVQSRLDEEEGIRIDYIHGWDTSVQLGRREGSVAVMLPAFDPHLLYPTVRRRGVLPRKAFSLGEAEEKRYYLEARRIS